MEPTHFDDMTRSLTEASSRRSVLTRLAGAAFAIAVAQLPVVAGARKKKRKKKLSLNTFGCVDVGKACRGNSGNCCSGICEGKKPKKGKKDKSRCIAHNSGACQETQDFCLGTVAGCGTNGVCARTTGEASFCAAISPASCYSCRKDEDCEVGFGPGAACVVCAAGCPGVFATSCLAADAGTVMP